MAVVVVDAEVDVGPITICMLKKETTRYCNDVCSLRVAQTATTTSTMRIIVIIIIVIFVIIVVSLGRFEA